ncbi:exo-alpha-sialidase [Trypanosoma cruzi]|nr:exo-alpha-sialidase [Trypanosoma cruzi]
MLPNYRPSSSNNAGPLTVQCYFTPPVPRVREAQLHSTAALLWHTVDIRCRQKSGNVVHKFTQLIMRQFADKPLSSCPSEFKRHTPLRACQCPMNGCVHAEVLVPPLGTG